MPDIMNGFIDYYASLVQPSLGMVTFLTNEIGNLSSAHILDAACGGGELAHALAVSGSVVTAVESEQALLLKAKVYSLRDKVPRALQFLPAPLLKLPGTPGSYHVLLCLNNASSVLQDEEEYQEFFKQAATLLNKGGRLVMQLFNYDMLLDYKVRELPELVNEKEGIRLQRRLRICNDGHLAMDTTLSLMRIDAKELARQEIIIYPIRRLQIQKMLQDAGFVVIDFYGGVEGTTWQEDSPSTLFLAIRG
ncbi:Glycine/sarcosine N-methyltransferase [bioreactor metagenome]|uniref:Glycine/sarcosine N-methyltransferase n=1 Tax=bioreactor metagenome TaxID=1076179 RepID=A0A645A8V9_9ZZZZ